MAISNNIQNKNENNNDNIVHSVNIEIQAVSGCGDSAVRYSFTTD